MSRPKHRCFSLVAPCLMCVLPVVANAQISFAPLQSYPLTAVPFRAVAADVNGDGKPDLVALSLAGGVVSVLLNHGNGTFASPLDFPALTPNTNDPGFLFSGIRLGDVNGDHNLDVIVTQNTDFDTNNGIINVLLGNGDGTFQAPVTTPVDFAYKLVGVGDFNSDGRLDVVCIADDPANTVVSLVLFLGNGDGTFTRASSSQPATGYPGRVEVALADLNHDGKLDVVIPTGQNFVEIFLASGDATFQPPIQAPTPSPAFYVSAGDFNHDGKLDLISTSYQQYHCECPGFGVPNRWIAVGPPGGVSTLLENRDGTFMASTFAAELGLNIAGDFDGDGNFDFAARGIAPPMTPGPLELYLGDGKGNFGSPTEIAQVIADPIATDLDGDGLADLVWPASNSSLQVVLNRSSIFALMASPGVPVPSGGTSSYTISVAQQHGQGAVVRLSCSAPAGSGIRCSLSPLSVAAGGTSTLSVTTTGPSAAVMLPSIHDNRLLAGAVLLPLAACFGIGRGRASRRKPIRVLMGGILSAGLIFQAACAGSGPLGPNLGTPSGQYTITVTGTAGTISRSTTVSLTVQ